MDFIASSLEAGANQQVCGGMMRATNRCDHTWLKGWHRAGMCSSCQGTFRENEWRHVSH